MDTSLLPEVVLVQDDLDTESSTLKGVSSSGIACHVTVRRDGPQAFDYLLDEGVVLPTLILVDNGLPAKGGIEVLARLRRHEKTRFVPIVMFGGTDSEEVVAECYRLGANSCVAKPMDALQRQENLALIARYWLKTNVTLDYWRRKRLPAQPIGDR